MAYRTKFIRAGFHVEIAEDGLIALKMLPRVCPDIVILDLMLPKFSGADVLKFIRSDAVLKSKPVIILSNAFMTELANEASRIGAELTLLKAGCTPSLLVAAINHIFTGNVGTFEPSRQLV